MRDQLGEVLGYVYRRNDEFVVLGTERPRDRARVFPLVERRLVVETDGK